MLKSALRIGGIAALNFLPHRPAKFISTYLARRRVPVFQRGLREVISEYKVTGPVCHVGSKNRDATQEEIASFRNIIPGEFVGIDIEPGPNVDVVADLCNDNLDHLAGKFGLLFCSALLEHVKNPFQVAANVQRLLRKGGHLYFAGPWVWSYHAYPDDYWRISFSGIKVLFPEVHFVDWWYSGIKPNAGIRIPLDRERSLMRSRTFNPLGRQLSDVSLPFLNITAVGVKG
jgi:SAM-dependent methyltransferase